MSPSVEYLWTQLWINIWLFRIEIIPSIYITTEETSVEDLVKLSHHFTRLKRPLVRTLGCSWLSHKMKLLPLLATSSLSSIFISRLGSLSGGTCSYDVRKCVWKFEPYPLLSQTEISTFCSVYFFFGTPAAAHPLSVQTSYMHVPSKVSTRREWRRPRRRWNCEIGEEGRGKKDFSGLRNMYSILSSLFVMQGISDFVTTSAIFHAKNLLNNYLKKLVWQIDVVQKEVWGWFGRFDCLNFAPLSYKTL